MENKRDLIQTLSHYQFSLESQHLDRKSARKKPSELLKHLIAFANADGGQLVIGIEDDKQSNLITGFRDGKAYSIDDFKKIDREMRETPLDLSFEEITRTIRATLGQRAKESLIVDFINASDLDSFPEKSDILEQFYTFARQKQKEAVANLIETEGLNAESASRYIQMSLKREYASENGNALNEALPKMSPLNPQYRTKKQTVFEKIVDLVEVFKGIGGEI